MGRPLALTFRSLKNPASQGDAMLEAGRRMREEMERLGITEDELVAGFKKWRKKTHAA